MVFNLASVDGESDDVYIGGSNTHIPRTPGVRSSGIYSSEMRETMGLEEDDGVKLGRSSVYSGSIYSKKRQKSMRKYRRDNQTYCGTPNHAKCSIF
jgi:hypothetical protein